METILKVLVGSQAHGLAGPDSDFDYRGVFINSTEDMFKIGKKLGDTNWIEGKEDDTSWEIYKFLFLSLKSNPTLLETYLAPVVEVTQWGERLKELFPYVWSSKYVRDAFLGYGLNQRKKFFEDKDKRAEKYAVAYLRTLYQGTELLNTGSFTIKVADTEIGDILKEWKSKQYTHGEVIQTCYEWQLKLNEAFTKNPDKQPDIDKINGFLVDIRKAYLTTNN